MALLTDSRGLGNVTGTALFITLTVAAGAIVAPYAFGMATVVDASDRRAAAIVSGEAGAGSTATAAPTTTATPTPTPEPTPRFALSADTDRSEIDWSVRRSVDADTLTIEHVSGPLDVSNLAVEVKGYTFAWGDVAEAGTFHLTRDDVPTTGLNLDGATVRVRLDGEPVATTTL